MLSWRWTADWDLCRSTQRVRAGGPRPWHDSYRPRLSPDRKWPTTPPLNRGRGRVCLFFRFEFVFFSTLNGGTKFLFRTVVQNCESQSAETFSSIIEKYSEGQLLPVWDLRWTADRSSAVSIFAWWGCHIWFFFFFRLKMLFFEDVFDVFSLFMQGHQRAAKRGKKILQEVLHHPHTHIPADIFCTGDKRNAQQCRGTRLAMLVFFCVFQWIDCTQL